MAEAGFHKPPLKRTFPPHAPNVVLPMQTATVPVEAELDAPVDRIASPDVGGVLPVAHASKPLDAASPVETRADAFEARPPMAVS